MAAVAIRERNYFRRVVMTGRISPRTNLMCATQLWVIYSPAMTRKDRDILEAAIVGLQVQRKKIDGQIAELHALLEPEGDRAENAPPKRMLSLAARKRMAAAQRRRWKAYRQQRIA